MKLLWIYFEVPYNDDAKHMRALLGVQHNDATIEVLATENCRDIPSAVQLAETIGAAKGFAFSPETVFIYPHDDRHGLAWPTKEQSELKGCGFGRQIPAGQYPAPNNPVLHEKFHDGSSVYDIPPHQAQQKVMDLNNEAKAQFAFGDMLPVFNLLRNALRISVYHFTWTHPITVLTLRNLQYAFIGSGNPDNMNEGLFMGLKFYHAFLSNPPAASVWQGSEMFIEHIADNMDKMNGAAAAALIRQLRPMAR